MKNRLPLTLSAAALLLAVVGMTPLGQAASNTSSRGIRALSGEATGSLERMGVKRGPRGPRGPRGLRGIKGATGPTGPQGAQGLAGAPGVGASASASFATSFGSEVTLVSETPVISLVVNGGPITTTSTSRLIATAVLAVRERASGTAVSVNCRLQIATVGGAFADMSAGVQAVSFAGAANDFQQVVVHAAALKPAGVYDIRAVCTGSAQGDLGARYGDLTVVSAAS